MVSESTLAPSMLTLKAARLFLHFGPWALIAREVPLVLRLTLPEALLFWVIFTALPFVAEVSLITLAPDGKIICSACNDATTGVRAKLRQISTPPMRPKITAMIIMFLLVGLNRLNNEDFSLLITAVSPSSWLIAPRCSDMFLLNIKNLILGYAHNYKMKVNLLQ